MGSCFGGEDVPSLLAAENGHVNACPDGVTICEHARLSLELA